MGIANITNNILTDSGITVTSLPSGSGTTNEISYWVSASSIGSLTTATYPSLTELSYVKGVTSAIQTQFSGKQDTLTLTTTGTSGAATLVGSTLNIPQYSGGGGMAIGGSITSATAGSVLFAGTSGVLQQDNANLFWDDTNNRLGVGTATPSSVLHTVGSVTASSAIAIGNYMQPTLVAAANNDVLVGLDVNPTFTVGAFTGLSNFGIRINQVLAASEPLRIQMVASPTGDAIVVKNSSNTTIYRVGSDGSMVSARWYDANNLTTLLSFPSNNFNVQLNGTSFLRLFNSTGNLVLQNGGTFTDGGQRLQVTGTSYFSDSVGIGSTSLTNISLRIAKNITGSTIIDNIVADGTVQSDATNIVNNYNSTLRTQATAFTLTNYRHFYAGQATLGASSAVSNQIGFFADAGLTGAANNYGFFGNIAAGTNRWNIYMQGTANNYMAGSLGIGSTGVTARGIIISKGDTGSTYAAGIEALIGFKSDVTGDAHGMTTYLGTDGTAFTLARMYHYRAGGPATFGSTTVTNQYGFYCEGLTGSTNSYAFFGTIAAGTGRWNLYMNGTANNYMAGSLGIGSTSLSIYNLRIQKNITGGTIALGISSESVVQSDVTSQAIYYSTSANTANTIFTLSQLFHYRATQSTFGASSTVNTQTGFSVDASLIGAVANYGFVGAIPSGTNRWNLYMSGTASNYLEGDTSIGTTSLGTATKFTLGGSETAVSAIARAQLINTTLTASANNDVLVGLDINPTFTNGAFTGVINIPLRIGTSSTTPFGSPLIFMGRDQNAESNFQISNSTSGTSALVGFRIFAANNRSSIIAEYSALHSTTEFASHLVIEPNSSSNKHGIVISIPETTAGSDLMVYTAGRASTNKRLTLFNSTGNLLLQSGGTHTDAGYKLDVNGSGRYQDSLTVEKSQNAITAMAVSNATNGVNSVARYSAISASNAKLEWGKYSPTTTTYKIVAGGDSYIYNNITGNISILNDFASGTISFAAGGSSTAHMTIGATGATTFSSSVTANSLVKSGGTASQILAADGSVITAGTNITISSGTISSTASGFTASGNVINTIQTTTSATYVDLATAGPSATVTIGASGTAIVMLTAQAMTASSGVEAYMGFAVSGATTVAASDTQALVSATRNTGDTPKSAATFWVTGLNAGSTTFTSKYRSGTSGTLASFDYRNIIVIPV